MKVFLLHRDRDFQVAEELQDDVFEAMVRRGDTFAISRARRGHERVPDTGDAAAAERIDALVRDLELETLWRVMAGGDEFLYEVARRGVLSGLADPEAIVYRQNVLADCIEHTEVVRDVYALAIEAIESTRERGGIWHGASADAILHSSRNVLELQVDVLKRLRKLADERAGSFRSEGFARFFAMLRDELDDDYLQQLDFHLRELRFGRGVLESAELGTGNIGRGYVVRRAREQRWTQRLAFGGHSPTYSFTLPARDEHGFATLAEIRGKGIGQVANAVAQSADHVKSFFTMLRIELAFYLGCVNLWTQLQSRGEPTCYPVPVGAEECAFDCTALYDVCLSFHLDGRVVGNDVHANGRPLIVITGANQGGKSTFLRSVGLAQLMLQSGMFVPAASLRASVGSGVFTHYKREEDAGMEGGKFDEELARMSGLADSITPTSLLLCNESFAATNEREGSEIARQLVAAMLANQVRVVFVTHMYDLAHSLQERHRGSALFLRAERGLDGSRPFRLVAGEPLSTSYGSDTFRRVFGVPLAVDEAPIAEARS